MTQTVAASDFILFTVANAKKEVALPAVEEIQPVQTQVLVREAVKQQSKPLADSVEKGDPVEKYQPPNPGKL